MSEEERDDEFPLLGTKVLFCSLSLLTFETEFNCTNDLENNPYSLFL